jgi:hypothetical protein
VNQHSEYKDYQDYVDQQIKRARSSVGITRRSSVRREWIFQQMQEHGVSGKNMLCVGARDKSELDFFREKGYEVEGIDLYKAEGIRVCDMSKMHIDPLMRFQRYSVVLSCESIEHCLDAEGFLKGLNVVCFEYFVCMCPVVKDPNQWDCQQWSFMRDIKDRDDLRQKLEVCFDEFDVITCDIHKRGTRLFFILKKNPQKTQSKYNTQPVKRIENPLRYDFIDLLPKHSVGVELGIDEGVFAARILTRAVPISYFAVDAYWKVMDKPWSPSYARKVQRAFNRIDKYDKDRVSVFVVDYSCNFLRRQPDNFFDWAYLDTSHTYVDTLDELDLLRDKVKDEGLICGHDFRPNPLDKHYGVTRAINEWLRRNEDYYLYLLDNHLQWIIRKR